MSFCFLEEVYRRRGQVLGSIGLMELLLRPSRGCYKQVMCIINKLKGKPKNENMKGFLIYIYHNCSLPSHEGPTKIEITVFKVLI